ncbi:unnamed protein product [Eruca vesicaria subsp. sativa]|uniref:F-box domain-containing protein n=1 Tax=Eruca vesicaria subsp. sativa TaxID=29727 RepID=A0ABC8KQC7_ERUVS|nr:unnamed protein product [Eruca vesicaria subsp. sativa]
MASSSLTTPVMKEGECRNWAELPSELMSDILRRLDSTDILENAQKVCTSWSSSLRSLRISNCYPITTDGLTKAIVNLPSLEELDVSYYELSGKCLKVVGQSLPNLKTLKLNCHELSCPRHVSDDDALAIAETMPGLRFLQLHGNLLSDIGLNAILDNCPNLEHLDLRRCLNVNIVGDLEKRCLERIKVLRRPRDSTDDFPYYAYA